MDIFYTKPFSFFYDKIVKNEHFRYLRFNDGELNAIDGSRPNAGNCDGHQYFPEMGKELLEILLKYGYSDDNIIESFDYWYKNLGLVRNTIDKLKIMNPNLVLLNTDFIRIAHEQDSDKYIELLNVLKEKNVVVVGPAYLRELNRFFSFRYIEVPIKNCYLEKDRIITEMKAISDNESDVFFLISASMGANIIIDKFDDDRNTYLNWGSTWDTFFVSPEYSFIKKRSTSNNEIIRTEYKDYLI